MVQSIHRWLIAATLLIVATAVVPSASFAYPERSVTIVVPFAPGSQPDLTARLIAKKLETRFKQPFIVENRAGAGGNVGAASVAQAPADGYRLLFASLSSSVFNPLIYKKMPYREDELTFISLAYQAPIVLGVPGASEVKTFRELVEKIRNNPRENTFGTAGIGTVSHVSGEMLVRMVGAVGVVHVPYRGTAAVIPDLLAGRLTFGFDAPGSYKPHLESGGIRGLLTTSDRQLPGFPAIPTIHEVGLPDFRARTWFGWRMRSDVPRQIMETLVAALIEINKDPEIVREYTQGAAEPFENSTPERAEEFLAAERKMWEPYVRASGAVVE